MGKREIFLAAALIFAAAGLGAQEEEAVEVESIEVRTETSPASPTVNNPWSVFILVNYSRPEEVEVDSPDFPASLALERIRTDTRTMTAAGGGPSERWTRVEFLFIPRRPETVSLGPFEVSAGGRFGATGVISATVQAESTGRYEPRFRWLAAPSGVRVGEGSELTLELTNWDPSRRAPQGFFRGRAPVNAILEEAAPTAAAAGAYRYRITVIPLESGSVSLDAFTFTHDTYPLSVPALRVTVLPARERAVQAAASVPSGALSSDISSDIYRDNDENNENMPAEGDGDLAFPSAREEVFFLFRGDYLNIIARVEALWREGLVADALAEIRKGERYSPAGPRLASLRRQMEASLGFLAADDEAWRPFGISLPVFALVFAVLVIGGGLLAALRPRLGGRSRGRNAVTSSRRPGFIIVIVLSMGAALGFALLGDGGGTGRLAVLRESTGYRIPDSKGAVNEFFSEGQSAVVGDISGEWCFVETLDGRSGWVRRESVINY